MEDITLTNETIEEYHQRLNGELRKEIQMLKDNEEYQRNRANSIEKLFLKASNENKEQEEYIEYWQKQYDELQDKIDTLKNELIKDRMEQFDDYVIYLQNKYLEILKGENNE